MLWPIRFFSGRQGTYSLCIIVLLRRSQIEFNCGRYVTVVVFLIESMLWICFIVFDTNVAPLSVNYLWQSKFGVYSCRYNTSCDDHGLWDRNLTQIRNTKTDVTKYKFIAVKPNQSNC